MSDLKFGGCPSCGKPDCVARQCAIALHAEHKPLFAEMIAQHPGLREEMLAEQAQPGFVMVAVKNLEPLLDALDRADRKGYLPDAMVEAWGDFELGPLSEPPKAKQPDDLHIAYLAGFADGKKARPIEPPKAPVEPVGEREQFEAWARNVELLSAAQQRDMQAGTLWSAWEAGSSNAEARLTKNVLAYLEELKDDAAAHIWPNDLERCQTSECAVQVASVRMGSPDGNTVPLFSRDQVAEAIDAARSTKGST